MYYVLSVSDDYPENYWFEYDHGKSPSYLSFQKGEVVSSLDTSPVFRIDRKISEKRLLQFDLFMSDGGDFVSRKFSDLLRSVAQEDVQLIEAEVYLNSQKIEGCNIPNIVHLISCVDMEKSKYKPLLKSDPDGPLKFTRFEFIENSLKSHKIVRCKEDPQTIVVSEEFVKGCESAGIQGVEFLRNGVRSYG